MGTRPCERAVVANGNVCHWFIFDKQCLRVPLIILRCDSVMVIDAQEGTQGEDRQEERRWEHDQVGTTAWTNLRIVNHHVPVI